MNVFHLGKGSIGTLDDFLIDQLRELYSAETQLIKTLPEMAEAACNSELRKSLEYYLEGCRHDVRGLERLFNDFNEDPMGRTSRAMESLINEGKEAINEAAGSEVKDAVLIAATQKINHYEIAGYEVVQQYAERSGHNEVVPALQSALNEKARMGRQLSSEARKVAKPNTLS